MFNKEKFQELLVEYKKVLPKRWETAKIQWEAVKAFQDNWNINTNDFPTMLQDSLIKTNSFIASPKAFPVPKIIELSRFNSEKVKTMFIDLFDESKDLFSRIDKFKTQAKELNIQCCTSDVDQDQDEDILTKSDPLNFYQDERAINTYLWLHNPQKYYLYRLYICKNLTDALKANYSFKKGDYKNNVENFYSFYNEINAEIKKDIELKNIIASLLTKECDPDVEFHTLTVDVCYYLNMLIVSQNKEPIDSIDNSDDLDDESISDNSSDENIWFLVANPKMWDLNGLKIGESNSYTFYSETGHQRRIFNYFLEAKVGDKVIGYISSPTKKIAAILEISDVKEGELLYFKKIKNLSNTISLADLKACPELQNMEFIGQNGSLFKLTKNEYDIIHKMIIDRNPELSEKDNLNTSENEKYSKKRFLKEVFISEDKYQKLVHVLKKKKNIILQGAPGVGKTFAAKRLAYSIMGEIVKERVEFIQFHQNYSYEDFIMGYKPVEDGFELKEGIFYRFCKKAEANPDHDYFFIIDEINRGNLSKIFGELLMLIEADYRDETATLAYNGEEFSVPKNLYIIGMMNTADRSLAMIDYALRRRFSFIDMDPGFNTDGFKNYQSSFKNNTFDALINKIQDLNKEIINDKSLGKGFCIGHSYFCNAKECTDEWMSEVIDYDIMPMLSEYWFDDESKLEKWDKLLHND